MKQYSPFERFVIRFIIGILLVNVACFIWAVRRGQADEIERAARIEQFQQQYIACDAGPDVSGWIGG